MNDELPYGDYTLVLSPACRQTRITIDGEVHVLIRNDRGSFVVFVREVDGVARSVELAPDVGVDWKTGTVEYEGDPVGWMCTARLGSGHLRAG